MNNFPNNKKWNGYNKITNQFNQEPKFEVSKFVDLIISYYIFLGLAKNYSQQRDDYCSFYVLLTMIKMTKTEKGFYKMF